VTIDWRPRATSDVLARRADLLRRIREFMARRKVLEVETPALSATAAADPNILSLAADVNAPGGSRRVFMHTSPEFPMKRLLADGSGPIFQIAKVFRDGELGRLHQPEFTMLEWYRPGFDHHKLMDEVAELLDEVGLKAPAKLSYAEAFEHHTGLEADGADLSCFVRRAAALGFLSEPPDRRALVDFLFSEVVAPNLGTGGAGTFIYDFPPDQAALARVRPGPPAVAERFELFLEGMEIANGFHELADAQEQRRRFDADNARRRERGLPAMPIDERLLAALPKLPDCAGVALGIDRLLMVLTGSRDIRDVLAFPFERS
jgi:lysyl-tRNA synthetase class 2